MGGFRRTPSRTPSGGNTRSERGMNDATPALLAAPVRTVPPEWIDYNGHMNVAYYGLAFDQSLDYVLEHALGIGPSFVKASGFGPYVVQNHVHYLAELLEGDRFRVQILIHDADAKRIHVYLEMLRTTDDVLVATSEQLLVNVDLSTRRAAPYPEDRRACIEELRRAHAALPRPERIGAPLGIRRKRNG